MSTVTIVPAIERKLGNRPSWGQTIRQSLTMARRGLLKVRHTPEQWVDVTILPVLFTLMFTYIFGGAISGSVKDYLPIIIPGILAQTVITSSVATGVQLREDMDKGVFDRFRSLPIARIAPLAGALLADTVRYLLVATITFTVGVLMGWRPDGGVAGLLGAGALAIFFAWCISWIFAFLGVIARNATSVQGYSMMILFPLTFLSNAFVPTNTLPGWLRWFAGVNPVSHVVTAMRQLAASASIGHDFWITVIGATLVVMVCAPLAVRAYMRKA